MTERTLFFSFFPLLNDHDYELTIVFYVLLDKVIMMRLQMCCITITTLHIILVASDFLQLILGPYASIPHAFCLGRSLGNASSTSKLRESHPFLKTRRSSEPGPSPVLITPEGGMIRNRPHVT